MELWLGVISGLMVVIWCVVCWRAHGADWGLTAVNLVDGFLRLYCRYFHRMRAPLLALPAQGPAIVVANHLSGLDPFLLVALSARPLRFLIAREQYERFGMNWLFRAAGCIPVDRDRNPQRALRAAAQALRQGEVLAVFPQGGIPDPGTPKRPLKGGAVRLAKRFQCAIYAVRLQGVRREGHVVSPLVLRGRVRVRAYAPFLCGTHAGHENCLHAVEQMILP